MLERLEVYNFKSYKGEQTIGPFKDFTCVIGPNGAGKSNLMDAVSFVLGVRSAQLRSSQLKDLIYRGGRKGLEGSDDEAEGDGDQEEEGSARNAWVRAIYIDSDDNEWRYQRTITSAGSSEYRINNKLVTYGKYNEQLESQNISVKAKNFLVFQGDVEAVASQSAKELTKLIEQISGSIELKDEYDKAKLASDRATDSSAHNMVKRRGMNNEMKQFKEQKGEAEKFERLQGDKAAAITHHLVWKLWHIKEGVEINTKKIEEKNTEIDGMKDEQQTCENALKSFRKEVAKAQKEVTKADKALKKIEKEVEDKEPELLAVETKVAHATKKHKRAIEQQLSVQKDLTAKQGSLTSLERELGDVQKASQKQQDAQRKASQARGVTLGEDDLREYQQLRTQANARAVAERQKLEEVERNLKLQTDSQSSAKDKLEQVQYKIKKLEGEETTLSDRKEIMEEKAANTQSELIKVRKELETIQAERARNSQNTAELNEKLADCYEKLNQAGADQKESDREARLKETLSTLQRIFPGVKGRAVDLVKPTQRKYDSAVTVVLGRNIDSVVVDTEKTAIDCIEYMRNQRAGQATFIPLDTIANTTINDKYRTFARGARLAIDIISYDNQLERAIHYICGNALICDSTEVAKYVCYERSQEVKCVTLDGTVFHKTGLITGGQDSRGNARKFEEKDVDVLRRKAEAFRLQLLDLAKQRPRDNDDRLVNDISRLESDSTVAKDDLAATEARLRDVTEELAHLRKDAKTHKDALNSASKSCSTLENEASGLQKTIESEEDEVFETFCQRIGVDNIREYMGNQMKVAEAENQIRLRFEVQIARLENQKRFDSEQVDTLEERLKGLQQTVKKEADAISALDHEKTALESEIETLKAQIESAKKDVQAANETHEDKVKQLENAKKDASKTTRAYDKATKAVAAWNDEIQSLSAERYSIYRRCKLEDIDLPLTQGNLETIPIDDNLRDTMQVDVDETGPQEPQQVEDHGIEVDFDELDEDERENSSDDQEAELLGKVAALTAEIERISPNMKAISKLDDMKAKLADTEEEFTKARDEAKSAREKFNDVKARRTKLFNKAFDHISNRIDAVYKDLTKGKAAPMGGVAYLHTEETDEPYLHGVKYHAMPPMKRFRDMEQLSGGEKTMAALALLFAIHSYHPSPFFVLDEVDAALDNTNVARISDYVRNRSSEEFQFIVISLKSSFWERAKGLVGIWRDVEKGTSSTLTLDLEKYDI